MRQKEWQKNNQAPAGTTIAHSFYDGAASPRRAREPGTHCAKCTMAAAPPRHERVVWVQPTLSRLTRSIE